MGALAPYRPSQRYVLVDARALGIEDLPAGNRVSALVESENSPTAALLAADGLWGSDGRDDRRRFQRIGYHFTV